uniref:Uncharacterized protein n=1 Tax=Oryza punctata TaxID=4537 RepID=A0A0E0M6Y9_ORYPU
MYVTRRMSQYLDKNPAAMAERPPEGPGSGFLVVVDEAAAERAAVCCCGLCPDVQEFGALPFPQSRQLVLTYRSTPHPAETGVNVVMEVVGQLFNIQSGGAPGMKMTMETDYVMFIPVVGLPLSSHRYYVVRTDGKHVGRVSACSREEDKTTCCFCTCVNDVPPRPFNHRDVYQQVEVQPLPRGKRFSAGAVAADGIPPEYLRRKGWKVSTESSKYDLTDDAKGVDVPLRRRRPDLGSSPSPSPVVVVGTWNVPFIFVRVDDDERRRVRKDLVRRCMFFRMTLEQSWKQIYNCTREDTTTTHQLPAPAQVVTVTATVRRSTPLLGGTYPVQEVDADGVKWFRPATTAAVPAVGALGLDMVVWERMIWELERGGWVAGDEVERIERVERCDVDGMQGRQWDKFGCYMLVETFVLTRMDGSVALSYQFCHTDKISAQWE